MDHSRPFFDVKQSCRAWNLSLMTINNTVSDGRSEKGLNWQTTGWTMCAYCNIRHYSWAAMTNSIRKYTSFFSRIFFRKQNVYATLELSVGVHTPQRRYVLDLLILTIGLNRQRGGKQDPLNTASWCSCCYWVPGHVQFKYANRL